MRGFTLSVNVGVRQHAEKVTPYIPKEISTLNDFGEAVRYDVCDVVLRNGYRDTNHFVSSNVLGMRNFLSVSELSKRYGVSRATIYNWLKTQSFPQGMKIERTRRWALDEILAWEAKKHD